MATASPDAVVVGTGPNGLAAALTLARAGLSVEMFEGASSPGGGCRTDEITIPGFHHDICSTIQSMVSLSPFFRAFPDIAGAVTMRTPQRAFAHPLDGGRVASVIGSVDETAQGLGADAAIYRKVMGPLVEDAPRLADAVLAPLRTPPHNPLTMARFARHGLPSASHLAKQFSTPEGKALMAGACSHAMLPLTAPVTAAFGLFLTATAHAGGWPVVEGGSARLVDAFVDALSAEGVTIHLERPVQSLADIPGRSCHAF